MSSTNSYIIFEADQVLTNDHLNEQFDYLDTQERLTRNKLIGIGIVCGLEVDNSSTSITVSKGCAVTSKGYLVVFDDCQLTQYVPYTLPANPLYKPFIKEASGKQYDLFRLLSNDDAKKIEGNKTLLTPAFLSNKVLVLFLEANEKDLKNCDTQDCNEKGREMDLTVRPLLINKADAEEIILKQKKLSGEDELSDSYIERLGLKDITVKRFDVKASPINDTFDIYNAYLRCFDDATFKSIADAYSQCYAIFKPILGNNYNVNPFKNLQGDLKEKLDYIKKSMPLYIQYYYDFVNDLVKAYEEFKERSFDVVTECCPDEDLFPMHIMLGEAAVNTQDFIRSPSRQYFISSPLFNQQGALINEVKLLFDRMVQLVKSLFIPKFSSRFPVSIKITPSRWGKAPLSATAIPYYYNINDVAKSWCPSKTKKGRPTTNLSYNADKYTLQPPATDVVLNPLLYSLDRYDFYRIEGHIGQNYNAVLQTILFQRNANRLPFDVIALKANADASNTAIKYNCHFEDLETSFAIIKAELACKMHEPVCLAAKFPNSLRLNVSSGTNLPYNFVEVIGNIHTVSLQEQISIKNKVLTSFAQNIRFTRKGDFIKTYCTIKAGTIGYEYVNTASKFYPRPTQIDLSTTAGARAALFHLIDIVESLMQTITGSSTIYSFNYSTFDKIYEQVTSYCTDFMQSLLSLEGNQRTLSPFLYGMLEAVVNACIDEKLKALVNEYQKRVDKIQKQNLLVEYLKSNPGIDHKAGVPRGGTFIIVYHETPPENNPNTISSVANTIKNIDIATNASAVNIGDTELSPQIERKVTLAETSSITQENLSQILKLFDTKEVKLSATQADTLKKLALQRFAGLAQRDPFVIPDKAVVADFYLPYICCSDCPPITYVLPKIEEVVSVRLDKTDYCNNDENTYPITVSPTGGKLTATAGGVDADKLTFTPKGVKAGTDTITYTLQDGRTSSLEVKISEAFEVDFEFVAGADDPLTVHFVPTNADNKTVSWDFGDGSTSNEVKPAHQYGLQENEQTFTVKLLVSDGVCSATKEKPVTVAKPKVVFAIEPTIFCSNDQQAAQFVIQPAIAGINEIKNPQGLKIEQDAAGNVFFIPAKQGVQQDAEYTLTYKDVTVNLKIVSVFTADFTPKPEENKPQAIRFVPQGTENRKVEWDFGDGSPVSDEQSPLHEYNFDEAEKAFEVKLTVKEDPCTVTVKHSVTVSKPKPAMFSIDPRVFCSSDKQTKTFKIQPPVHDAAEINNPDKLRIEVDPTGNALFVPAKQDVAATKEYHLNYMDIDLSLKIIVANAGFTMNIELATVSTRMAFPTLTLKAKQTDGDEYKWRLTTATGAGFDFTGREVKINYNQLNLTAGAQLTIFLTVSYSQQTGVACKDTKDYVLTEQIFRNHLNKGEFDNVTPA